MRPATHVKPDSWQKDCIGRGRGRGSRHQRLWSSDRSDSRSMAHIYGYICIYTNYTYVYVSSWGMGQNDFKPLYSTASPPSHTANQLGLPLEQQLLRFIQCYTGDYLVAGGTGGKVQSREPAELFELLLFKLSKAKPQINQANWSDSLSFSNWKPEWGSILDNMMKLLS